MRTAFAYLAGFITAIFIWMIPVIILDLSAMRMGALPSLIVAGIAMWVGIIVVDHLKAPVVENIDEAIESENKVSDLPAESQTADDTNTPPKKNRDVRKIDKISNIAILFLFAGLAAGYIIRHYMGPEEFAVPQTRAECYVALANARTERGAEFMELFCEQTFVDFYFENDSP